MRLLDKIEELQNKPESYRRKVLIAVMLVITPAILAVWIFTFNLPSTRDEAEKVEIQAPFAIVLESFTGIYGSVKFGLSGLKFIGN